MKKGLSYSIASVVVLVICLIAFVLPSTMSGGQNPDKLPPFGKYDGKKIEYVQGSDFANYVSYYGQMIQAQYGQLNDSSYYQVFNFAFNSAVTKLAYEAEVKNSGYAITIEAKAKSVKQFKIIG